jgi:protein-S-isoprenylcysteine O-methyltransferase Ste14
LVLWTAPTWTPDWLLLAVGWSLYCVVGPRRKEARWQRQFGERFLSYRQSVPYLLPRLFR